ncbi:MAG TPA: cupin domain-containing protein [Chloroflexia bacterium]|nr:cupin domain-containing protein [Chloroflexia bacterium]
MSKLRLLSVLVALLSALPVAGVGSSLAQTLDPTVSFQGSFPLTVQAGEYDLTYLVLDFAPGASIPLHYHGGPALVVGMEGALTLRPEGGTEHVLAPGDVMNEQAGVKHVMINTGTTNSRIMAVVLLPKGADLTTVVDTSPNPPPGPTVPFQGDYPISVTAGDYDLVNLVLNFAPGASIPLHYHGGPVVVVGLEGMLTLRPEGGSEHMVMPGDVMNEKAGARHVMINTGTSNASIMAGVLLPKGAELTTVVAQPVGMPTTGLGSLQGVILAVLLVALLSILLGSVARFAQSRKR